MINREAFEAWFKLEIENTTDQYSKDYMLSNKELCHHVWQAALASQAQQPNTNQRLIDAAPDLLDALKTILAAHKEKPPTTVMQAEAELDRIRSAASKAREAIAKAEGKDQEIGNVLPEFQKFKNIESYESAVKKQGFVLNFEPLPPAPEGDKS